MVLIFKDDINIKGYKFKIEKNILSYKNQYTS